VQGDVRELIKLPVAIFHRVIAWIQQKNILKSRFDFVAMMSSSKHPFDIPNLKRREDGRAAENTALM
jgi:hypothetical protein